MNRRVFLATLLAGTATALDPERLVWVPGRKKIFIPPARTLLFDPALSGAMLRMLDGFRFEIVLPPDVIEHQRWINRMVSEVREVRALQLYPELDRATA